MHKHLIKRRMIGGHDRHLIVDSATAVNIRICKYDDMLERNARQQVIDLVYVSCGEVAIAVERAVMRSCGGIRPLITQRYRRPRLKRRSSHSHHVKPILHAFERLTSEESLNGTIAIGIELIHFCLGISLGKYGDVDAVRHVHIILCIISLPYIAERYAILPYPADKDIIWINGMHEFGSHHVMVVRQGHSDINLILREWYVIACLECPVRGLCLCLKLPFLKEC